MMTSVTSGREAEAKAAPYSFATTPAMGMNRVARIRSVNMRAFEARISLRRVRYCCFMNSSTDMSIVSLWSLRTKPKSPPFYTVYPMLVTRVEQAMVPMPQIASISNPVGFDLGYHHT